MSVEPRYRRVMLVDENGDLLNLAEFKELMHLDLLEKQEEILSILKKIELHCRSITEEDLKC